MINSEFLDGLSVDEARERIKDHFEEKGWGKRTINYKLRDWIFSRQRYWGEPIPLIHISQEEYQRLEMIEVVDAGSLTPEALSSVSSPVGSAIIIREAKTGSEYLYRIVSEKPVVERISPIQKSIDSHIIADYSLPLLLPETPNYEPSADGASPLARIPEWVAVDIADNLHAKRETNTMPQWAGSSWYYLRFMDPDNAEACVSREMTEYWEPVDEYIGGAEHAVLHLLYARFWHKVLFDIGVVKYDEPFQKRRIVGLILGPDGEKMSKSRGNVVNPTDIIDKYGADTLRLYEMFMSDFRDAAPWDDDKIIGMRRLLDRIHAIFTE